ncbi:MAG: hypothetical protein O2894_05280 [Planctomycetota bacterium]|nr:hypothetical protein [Planctomycetota bacterium]
MRLFHFRAQLVTAGSALRPIRVTAGSALRPILGLAVCAALAVLVAAPAQADTLELTDGRLVEGLIIPDKHPEHGEGVYVVSRFGPTFVPKADIKARREAQPVDAQIRAYLGQLKDGDIKNRVRLASWMLDLGREEEGRELLSQILDWDPECPAAHKLLGHERYRGQWVTHDEAQTARGLEKHGDSWYTPTEWQNVADADKRQAAEAEKAAAARAREFEVNQAVRLALSPDPAVRSRGQARLEALAKEYDSEKVRTLIAGVDEYLVTLDELRRKAAAMSGPVGVTSGGMVMGEIRATLSKLKRPIPVFQTNLAAGPIGANAPVSIQLPELEVIRVMSTMAVPALVDD